MNEENVIYHTPAMLKESMESLNIRPDGVYVDATFGGGGHSRAILEQLGDGGRLYAFDRDMDATRNIIDDKRFKFTRSNFRYIANFMHFYEEPEIDGILADLGVSSHHFDDEERGFSYRFNGRLDMRMNRQSGKTAADVLNTYPQSGLAGLFRDYGELRNAGEIASRIAILRDRQPFRRTSDLLEALEPFCGRENDKKFLSQVFQALRIEVNDELTALRRLLIESVQLLRPGGRLVVLSYHSLEDRLVKNFIKTGNFEGEVVQDVFGNVQAPFRAVNKMKSPTFGEISDNPRARSAKLRTGEKLTGIEKII